MPTRYEASISCDGEVSFEAPQSPVLHATACRVSLNASAHSEGADLKALERKIYHLDKQ
jgi:hypothetical protein